MGGASRGKPTRTVDRLGTVDTAGHAGVGSIAVCVGGGPRLTDPGGADDNVTVTPLLLALTGLYSHAPGPRGFRASFSTDCR